MKFCLVLALSFLLLSNVALADLMTERPLYRPGETVVIMLSYPHQLSNFQLSVKDSNGTISTSKQTMKSVGSNLWAYNFTIKPYYPNGVYVINVNASEVGAVVNPNATILIFNKTFNVSAWSINSYLNKYSFIEKERVNLTALIKDRFSEKLTFYVSYVILDANGRRAAGSNFTLSGVSKGFEDFFDIPENYTLGNSSVFITISDSDGRYISSTLNFTVSKPLTFQPRKIEQTVKNEVIQVNVTFENKQYEVLSIDSVDVFGDMKGAVTIVQRPYVIPQWGFGIMELRIDTLSLSENVYNGGIIVSTMGVNSILPISMNVVPEKIPEDNTYIIWCFAIGIIVAISIITFIRYRSLKNKPKTVKVEPPKKKIIYKQPQGEYRADYY